VLRALPAIIAASLALVTVIAMVILRPTGEPDIDLSVLGINAAVYDATAIEVVPQPCTGTTDEDGIPCVLVTFRIDEGPDTGEFRDLEFPVSDTSPSFAEGDRVVLDYRPEAEERFQYSFFDRQRRPVLLWVSILFAVAVIALGRLRGVAALFGLGVSVLVLLKFMIPAILDGKPPVLIAVVGAAAIAYAGLYAAHGFNRMTTVALLGTLAALALTALLAWFAVGAAELTGLADDASFIITLVGTIDLSGLVLAGVVLGSVGAVDDVTITQASAVWEIRRARPDMSRRDLMRSGLRVGRDHVASMVNTLLLAYAGAAMPLLIFFVLSSQSIGTVLNTEIVATEVLRTLIGSIGLVASVPLTTWLAAWTASDDGGGGHAHGHGIPVES